MIVGIQTPFSSPRSAPVRLGENARVNQADGRHGENVLELGCGSRIKGVLWRHFGIIPSWDEVPRG